MKKTQVFLLKQVSMIEKKVIWPNIIAEKVSSF